MTPTMLDMSELPRLATWAGRELADADPVEILRWAADTFGDRFAVASSMGDGLMADLASRARAGIDVVFLDTGYHFAETIGTRDAVAAVYDVQVRTVLPVLTVQEQDRAFGPRLHERDPDACCRMRKVEPMSRGLAPYLAWASGIRRDETESRRDIEVVEYDARRRKVKVNPLAAWTREQVDAYVVEHGIVVNPLTFDGYASIGCAPCTHRVAPGQDPRSGRWAGLGKTECGLHV
jgi:phosphoadenosine phosphosulfate reductase